MYLQIKERKSSRRRDVNMDHSMMTSKPRRSSSSVQRMLLLLLGSLLACSATALEKNQGERELRPWKKISRIKKRETVVTDAYIVLLHDLNDLPDVLTDYKIKPLEVYRYTLQGFAVERLLETTFNQLLVDPRVELVGEDGVVEDEQESYNGPSVRTQSPAVWNLDRIDGNGNEKEYQYRYDGTGVDVYILDSGIRATHTEFEGRVAEACFADVGPCNSDGDSHGTHVAGIVGGRKFGVAKGATLHDVRIRDANNTLRWAYLFAGWDYVVAVQRQNPDRRVIVNVSYSGGSFDVADRAAEEVVNAGVIMVAAAGNQNEDACDRSPARVPGVIAVGSMAEGDVQAQSSNFGPCVDIWAPGRDILSAGFANDDDIQTKSGTSMAAPMVAGVLAMYMQAGWTLENMLADAEYVDALTDRASTGRLVSVRRLIEGGTRSPTMSPSTSPTTSNMPSSSPVSPTASPIATTNQPTEFPTFPPLPTFYPTQSPSHRPSEGPSALPSVSFYPTMSLVPSNIPTAIPTQIPSTLPSMSYQPTSSFQPSGSPTTSQIPSFSPSLSQFPTLKIVTTFAPAGLPRAGGGGFEGPTVLPSAEKDVEAEEEATLTTEPPTLPLLDTTAMSYSAPSMSMSVPLLSLLLALTM